jgi:3-methyladenine DNA glycosylase/8-oxoguanine DNA glycosylase
MTDQAKDATDAARLMDELNSDVAYQIYVGKPGNARLLRRAADALDAQRQEIERIRAATIEECARAVESESYRDEHGERAAEIIRALAPSQEAEHG